MEQKPQKIKTKVRFTSLDVAAVVSNMQALIGMRATNIYDINPTTYMVKLAKSEQKTHLLIENGIRFHTTEEKPDKKAIPSGFTMKFRKFLRSKRLEGVRQVGVERVVVFTFGSQAFTNHLILQLYAQGNIILTDNNYRILQCIRSHEFNDKVKTAVGQIYPFEYAANIYLENLAVNDEVVDGLLEKEEKLQAEQENPTEQKKKKKNKSKGPAKLKDIVFKMLPCLFPLVIEHILLSNNKNPEEKVTRQNKQLIIDGGKICLQFLKEYLKSKHKGYLFQKIPSVKQAAKQEGKEAEVEYFDFCSYKNIKYKEFTCREYPTFNDACNEYFLKYKATQNEQNQQFQEVAWKKYEQIKKDQDQRVKKLQEEQDIYKLKAEYIEKNVEDVDAIIKIIKTMEDNGYSWEDISRMIEQSKKNGDPLANNIHEMNIYKRLVVVLLGDPIEQEQNFELLPVQINIDYNAYTNATMYYESKKKNFQKEQRTKEASQQVLKVAQKEAIKKIEKKQNEVFIKNLPQRKVFWFEKFNWFISSEGYLIISGRDSHQNELVVKRYMRAGDLYMHADYGGAASTVIKKHIKQVPVPRNTLEEAAIFTVCRSKAWDTKILSGAWWVYHDQVSKSAPTGQFLPTGSFMIRGKRNFIQPNRMEMGLTMLFKVDNQSAIRHINDRKIHEEELRKEQEGQNSHKKHESTDQKSQQEEFAIISIDMQTKKFQQRQEEVKQQKLQKVMEYNKKKEERQRNTLNADQAPSKENSEDGSGQQQDDSEDEKPSLQNKKSAANNVKKSQANGGKKPAQGGKKVQDEAPQEKHKQRKKKKLKKLEKYLEEQDQEEREMIMKMLGAKQMKHMQENDEEEEQTTGDKRQLTQQQANKKKKRDKKALKGKKKLNKYLGIEDDEEEMKKLNPDKVLFLKTKQQKQAEQIQAAKKQQKSSSEQQKGQQAEGQQEQNEAQENDKQEEMQQKQASNEEPSDQEQEEEENKGEQKKEQPEQEVVDDAILDSELGELYKLVGKPHPQDQNECLVAMCAPYLSIKDNRFKVKLVPGSLKKGKAARNILHFFSNNQLNEQEKGLVRSVPEQQLINAVIGNVKLAGAGLLKMQLKSKNDKKQKCKQQDKKKEGAN